MINEKTRQDRQRDLLRALQSKFRMLDDWRMDVNLAFCPRAGWANFEGGRKFRPSGQELQSVEERKSSFASKISHRIPAENAS